MFVLQLCFNNNLTDIILFALTAQCKGVLRVLGFSLLTFEPFSGDKNLKLYVNSSVFW